MKKLSLKDRIRVAAEELEEARPEEKVDASVDVTEAIQQENDMAEIDADIVQYKADQNALEELEEVEEVLVEQAVENNEKLQDGENVNPEDVQASQEAIRYAKLRCGFSLEEIKRDCHISYEGMKESPYTMLQISQEGIKDALKWVWKKIKEFFQKIIEFFKKIWKKILAFFGSYNAKIDLVIKKLEGAKWNSVGKLSASQVSKVNKLITPAVGLLCNGDIGKLEKALSYTDNVKRVTTLNNLIVSLSGIHNAISDKIQVEFGMVSKELEGVYTAYKEKRKNAQPNTVVNNAEVAAKLQAISKAAIKFNNGAEKMISDCFSGIGLNKNSTSNEWGAVGDFCEIARDAGICVSGCGSTLRVASSSDKSISDITIMFDKDLDYSDVDRSTLLNTIKKLRSYTESLKAINLESTAKEVIKNIEKMDKSQTSKGLEATQAMISSYIEVARDAGVQVEIPHISGIHKLVSTYTKHFTKRADSIVLDYSKNLKAALDACVYLGHIATGEDASEED